MGASNVYSYNGAASKCTELHVAVGCTYVACVSVSLRIVAWLVLTVHVCHRLQGHEWIIKSAEGVSHFMQR
jgi:hypothetical protein